VINPTDSYRINISLKNSLKRNSLKNKKTLSKQIVLPLKIYSLIHLITPTEDKAISNRPLSASNCYFLPKIHKNMKATKKNFPGIPNEAISYLLNKNTTKLTSHPLKLVPGPLKYTRNVSQQLPSLPLVQYSLLVIWPT
jgi:hypothetical protein